MKKTQKKKKTAPATPDAYEFLNRELSWLEFNQRVLLEACNPKVPLLERLKFLSITASNLDEFCMVRVGGLKMLVAANIRRTDPSGMTPRQQLVAVTRRMRKMVADQYELLEVLSKELAKHGFVIQESVEDLSDEQRKWLEREFMDNIFPLLSPVGVGEERPFRPAGLLSHCVATLAPTTPDEASRMVFIPLGPKLPRFIRIPDADGRAVFIPIEQVVAWQVAAVVEGQSVVECVPFRVTRNADIELREDLSSDLLAGMQELLDDRRETECIRLEIHCRATRALVGAMKQQLGLEQADVYLVDGPVELRSLMSVTQTDGFEDLRDEPWEPVPSPDVDIKESMFPQIAQGDILLVHPYDSFDPVVKLLNDAADDPQVLAIKQVLYRTASQSAIVEALIRAAQVGKHVTVLIELKARFDEARNISQARRLELAGAHVVYGVRSLKTHAKICLVVRREPQGIVRYVHFGTGNYNEKTATLYSDVGLFTCRNDFGADASDVFNAITGYSQPQSLRRLEVAPFSIRSTILALIANEAERARNNEKAEITMKMNSLSDKGIIAALYSASKAGVKIRLNIRGICCLKPGVPGMSENITVVSIVDYYLEHARIFRFRNGGLDDLYISSADMMTRNLDKRIELMIPVLAPGPRKKLLATLDVYFTDCVKARTLCADGEYRPVAARGKEKPIRAQEELYRRAKAAASLKEQTKPTMLEPHHRKRNPQTDVKL